MKKKVTYVFVILVYRNITDIIETLQSISHFFDDYVIVIVNSYYDDESKKAFERIALKYKCDFINVENRGYSYGNNKGIEYCHNNYEYDYIVVSNPDIVIKKFDFKVEMANSDIPVVYAPVIRTLSGKMQNPYWVIKNNIAEAAMYNGCKKNRKVLINLGIGMNKVIREIFVHTIMRNGVKHEYKIYAAHGSFLMVSHKAVELLGTNMFDENMFLFGEEAYLAHRLEELQISVYLTKDIEILHKEDGSMKMSNIDQHETTRHSVVYYYERYRSQGK